MSDSFEMLMVSNRSRTRLWVRVQGLAVDLQRVCYLCLSAIQHNDTARFLWRLLLPC